MTDLKTALGRLYALAPQGPKLGLERMQAACAHFENPEKWFQVIHVAGTNGKGSVCAFVASMLRASGKKVGLYTSPHLMRCAERIQIGGQPIADDDLARLLTEVMDAAPDLTFFEVLTLVAFRAFHAAEVDYAVLEVGLGGRLDATNVVPGAVMCAITRVAFDHMDLLGDSLAAIAKEKVGIIKKGSKVVTGKLHPDAFDAVAKRIEEVGATFIELGPPEPFAGAQLAYPRMAMFGTNLAVASTIARELGISPEHVAEGIETTSWPGRNELLHRSGQELTLLDCAHNPDGAVTLSHVIDASILGAVGSRRDVALVFGTLKSKNHKAMLDRLDPVAAHKLYVAPPVKNAADPADMVKSHPGKVVATVEEALEIARSTVGTKGLVVVTGSTFLVGAARAKLLGLPTDPPVDL